MKPRPLTASEVLIVVHSHPSHYADRMGIRNTYGARKRPGNLPVIFLLGKVINSHEGQQKLEEEQMVYGDILQVSKPFVKIYESASKKKRAFCFQLFFKNIQSKCNQNDYNFPE